MVSEISGNPESLSSRTQGQLTILQEESDAGLMYNAIADRFLDKDLPRRFLDGRKKACWNGCLEDANEPV